VLNWSARMILRRFCLVALTLASVVPNAVAAPKQRHVQVNEFFARAPEEVETISLPQK
jgi:hypothetical protein